ncbi:MAG TPA: acetate--CoA ligase, partial [Alphaproteobacteria bacterium]|nr:acetate--CoA ligase [Alphaproteobacteria bacterium]
MKDLTVTDFARYQELYVESINNPDAFWREQARRLNWHQFPTKIENASFDGDVSIKWFEDGTLNVSENCLDRHLAERGDETAIIWVGDAPGQTRRITFREAHAETCRMADVLLRLGVKRGDCVTIYLPMIPEAAYAMLACARIGAMHSVVFAGFSAHALAARIQDGNSKIVITADISRRGGKTIALKQEVDEAAAQCPDVKNILVVKNGDATCAMQKPRDHWYHDLRAENVPDIKPAEMNAEDILFILYTSGSTGRPKGVVHTTGGYLLYAALTHATVFDARPGDIYWCTADIGWVTGHSYVLYGPLANGVTTVMFEGVPSYPDASRFWQIVDELNVTQFYTAPTAIRALMREGDDYVKKTSRKSLRVLGSVGEPINETAWNWYHDVVGNGKSPVVDTWWQTETGGHMITPLPHAIKTKPGSATLPFFGVVPAIMDSDSREVHGAGEGHLCISRSWPGQARTLLNDHKRFVETYFSTHKSYYFSGDGVRRDADGYYWITGRVDDVINVSGHRIGTAEVETAINSHPSVAESAVVGMPHDIKGQGIFAYVILKDGMMAGSDDIRAAVNDEIGPIAKPDKILMVPGLPKTRSGKIMRRILRKIAEGDT